MNEIIKDYYEALKTRESPEYLYKFYSLSNSKTDKLNNSKIKTFTNKQIWLDLGSNQNDPFELINVKLDDTLKLDRNYQKLYQVIEYCINNIKPRVKISSFTCLDCDSMSMWAYYSNDSKGFCAKFKVNNKYLDLDSPILPIFYKNRTYVIGKEELDIFDKLITNNKDDVIQGIEFIYSLIKLLSSYKSNSWSHELEYRALIIDNKDTNGKSFNELNIDLKDIYLGMKWNINSNNDELPNYSKYIDQLKDFSNTNNVNLYDSKANKKDYKLDHNKIN